MKFSVLFVFALAVFGVLLSNQSVEGNERGSNIVMKDGHLVLSTGGRRDNGGDNIVIKDDHKCCECYQGWWW